MYVINKNIHRQSYRNICTVVKHVEFIESLIVMRSLKSNIHFENNNKNKR